jgi:hypothetical protein
MRTFVALLGLLAIAGLSGCEEGPPVSTPPEMTFDNLQPLQINAEKIEVVDNYKPPLQDPNVEHTFRTPPYTAAEKLLKKQLVPAGNENTLRAIVEDASVVREELPITRGIAGAFMQEPAEKLKAKVLVRFELVDPKAPDIVIGHAEVIARREKSLMEGISVADRDRAYFALTEDLMDDVNDGLRSIVKNTFGKK